MDKSRAHIIEANVSTLLWHDCQHIDFVQQNSLIPSQVFNSQSCCHTRFRETYRLFRYTAATTTRTILKRRKLGEKEILKAQKIYVYVVEILKVEENAAMTKNNDNYDKNKKMPTTEVSK